MKKIVFLAMLTVCFINIKAQNQNFDFLRGVEELDVELDYSIAKFEKKWASDFFMLENSRNPNWEIEYKKEMLIKFVISANSYLPSWCIIKENFQNAKYKIIVKVIKLDDDKDTDANILIVEKNSGEILAQFSVYGAAGTFGSFKNLSGDAMENVGKKAGKFLAKKIR